MNTEIEINGGVEMKLSDALLIYTADSKAAYVTHHGILNGQLGPAKPLTNEFLTSLSEQLERRVKVEVLPEKVLVRTPHTIVWWTPERHRRMYFTSRDHETDAIDGLMYAQPAMVWMVTGRELFIRAMATSERPTEATKLYRAPFWNTSDTGDVCEGDMKRPDTTTARTIDVWEEGFYASRFSHPNATKLLNYPRPYIEFVRNVLIDCVKFPTEYLVDAKQTLEQFIEKGGR